MNSVILMGRVCTLPEIKIYSKNNIEKQYARFLLAIPDEYDRNHTDFIPILCFGEKRANFVSKYIPVGVRIVIRGRIHTKEYTKHDEKRYYTSIISEKIEFADKVLRDTLPEEDLAGIDADFIISQDDIDSLPIS